MDICKDIGLCPHDEFCGGCIYQGIAYEKQLEIKENEVLRLMADSGIEPDVTMPIKGSPCVYGYRNKMEYTFGDFVKGGEMTLGMHRKGKFMSVVTTDHCQLVPEDFNQILRGSLDFCSGYPIYHKKTHEGLLRNLVVRRGVRTNEILINIVTASGDDDIGFDEAGYARMIGELPLDSKVVGILHTINDDPADAVKPGETRIIRGRDYYMDRISGLDFKVSAFSFFQTNIEAVERLYEEAISLIDAKDKTVFDLFCGTGTITQSLAVGAKKAIGIEIVEEAVESARANAALNGISNSEFIAGDVFEVMDDVAETPDLIVCDPPRMGIASKAIRKISGFGAEQILYISCNPKTLFPNLKEFQMYGYKARYVKPYDNFPFTRHVETVCLMSRVDK